MANDAATEQGQLEAGRAEAGRAEAGRAEAGRGWRKAERQAQILVKLRDAPHLRTADLAALFGVTTETIRRDVEALSQAGKLSRSYGGVVPNRDGAHPDLDARKRENLAERACIARCAAGLVEAGETLMIDAGATTIETARALALAGTSVLVITNSLYVAAALASSPAAKVVLCPGEYLAAEGAVIGSETIEFLTRHHVDRAFLGASGLSESGATEAVPGFASVKRAMLRQARAAHLLIDSSKFGKTHLTGVAGLEGFRSIVSDRWPEGPLLRCLGENAAAEFLVAPA